MIMVATKCQVGEPGHSNIWLSVRSAQQWFAFFVLFAVLMLVCGSARALEEIGPVENDLAPYVPGILPAGLLVSYQKPEGYTYTIETLKATEVGRRIRGADDCIYTYGDVPLPYYVNKTCPLDPTKNKTRSVSFKRRAIDSLTRRSKFKFYHTPERRRFTIGCKVKTTVRVRVLAGDFDTYKLRCQSGRGYTDWYLSPELGLVVAQTFVGDPRRELAGLQPSLVVSTIDSALPPYTPNGIPSDGTSLLVVRNGVEKLYTNFEVSGTNYSYLDDTCRTTLDTLFEWAWFANRECESGYSVTGNYKTERKRSTPITIKSQFSASYHNINAVNGRKVNLNVKCQVSQAVRIDILVREIDTYQLDCETPYQVHTSWLSPELGRAVADQWYHKKKKRRSIRIFLEDIQ